MKHPLLKQLGWHGILGLLLLIAAVVLSNNVVAPMEKEQANQLERNSRPKLKVAHMVANEHQQQQTFLDNLPTDQQALDTLAKIYLLAQACGVSYQQAEYHLEKEQYPRREYTVSFPAQGSYKNLHYFVARVLSENPAVSLELLNLERQKVDEAILDAKIRLTIFLRPQEKKS